MHGLRGRDIFLALRYVLRFGNARSRGSLEKGGGNGDVGALTLLFGYVGEYGFDISLGFVVGMRFCF